MYSFNEAAIFRSRKGGRVDVARRCRVVASMRPRSFDRGKHCRRCQGNGILFVASMRPRSFDRGKQATFTGRTEICEASMRPRSFDRGKAERLRWQLCWAIGFNEAAIFRSRKELVGQDHGMLILASMRPRSFDRGKGLASLHCAESKRSFNEAAIFRSRKVLAVHLLTFFFGLLQ